MKTVRIDKGHNETSLTTRPVNVPEIGRCVQIEGASFSVILTRAQAQLLAITLLRMSA